MAVSNSKVGFCNEALLLLASKPIASFDEGTDKASVCSSLYERTVGTLLAMRTWRFTVQKVALARLVAAPANEWSYAFQLPADLVAGPWRVFNSTAVGARSTTAFQIFGDKLYSDDPVVVIEYQAEPDVSKFPVLFTQLVVNALAAAFAAPVTEQSELAAYYREIAFGTPSDNMQGGLFRVAAQADAKSKPSDALPADEVTAARFS